VNAGVPFLARRISIGRSIEIWRQTSVRKPPPIRYDAENGLPGTLSKG
jgi:hypothetical protein